MKGYTCCIDLHELGNTIEVIDSVENCIFNNNLANNFSDIENDIKKESFEHGNCFLSFTNTFKDLENELNNVEKELFQLNYALQKTIIICRQSDNLKANDLKELSEHYGDYAAKNTGENLYMNPSIIIADNKYDFEKEINPFVRALTDFKVEDNSLPDTIKDFNQLPIGISIVLTGATASTGAAMIQSIRKSKKELEENKRTFKSILEEIKNNNEENFELE